MNFYHACYTRQYYDEEEQTWQDTDYKSQGIIVIADNYDDAKLKIEKCLAKVETNTKWGDYRAVLNSDITECIGLDSRHGYNSFNVLPVF